MERILLTVLGLILFISCKSENRDSVIIIKNSDMGLVEITSPIDGIILWNNKKDTVSLNQEKEFVYSKTISTPEYVEIKIGEQYLKAFLLGDSKVEITAKDSTFSFAGKNDIGFEFFNKLNRPLRPYHLTIEEFTESEQDSTAKMIIEKINSSKNPELQKLQSIYANDKIDSEFFEICKTEIDYFYALKTLQIILAKHDGKVLSMDLISLFEETRKNYPVEISYKPSAWNEYAEQVLLHKPKYDKIAKGLISQDSLTKLYQTDGLNKFNLDLILANNDPKITEKVAANYLYTTMIQSSQNEKSLIAIFEDFKEHFPKSKFSDYIKPEIDKIKDYHEKVALDLPEDVNFIADNNITTFSELIEKLKGQKYYIDVWATWCGPCKKEFEHNEELNVLLGKKGYKKLYISIDNEDLRDIWIENIKYYDLIGSHILASKKFSEDFADNFAIKKGQNIIPQYLILDENGNLTTNNAPKPSNLSELEKAL